MEMPSTAREGGAMLPRHNRTMQQRLCVLSACSLLLRKPLRCSAQRSLALHTGTPERGEVCPLLQRYQRTFRNSFTTRSPAAATDSPNASCSSRTAALEGLAAGAHHVQLLVGRHQARPRDSRGHAGTIQGRCSPASSGAARLTPCSNTDRSPGLSIDRDSTLQQDNGHQPQVGRRQ